MGLRDTNILYRPLWEMKGDVAHGFGYFPLHVMCIKGPPYKIKPSIIYGPGYPLTSTPVVVSFLFANDIFLIGWSLLKPADLNPS